MKHASLAVVAGLLCACGPTRVDPARPMLATSGAGEESHGVRRVATVRDDEARGRSLSRPHDVSEAESRYETTSPHETEPQPGEHAAPTEPNAAPASWTVTYYGATHDASSTAFDGSLLDRQTRARLRAMQTCFARSLPAGTPSFRMEVAIRINPDGTTEADTVRNESGVTVVEGCIVNTISRFRFRWGPTGGVSRYRAVFEIVPR